MYFSDGIKHMFGVGNYWSIHSLEELFNCNPVWSKTNLFFCLQVKLTNSLEVIVGYFALLWASLLLHWLIRLIVLMVH